MDFSVKAVGTDKAEEARRKQMEMQTLNGQNAKTAFMTAPNSIWGNPAAGNSGQACGIQA